ncbi:2-pyrone-4,6-dicarboxylate hydrolase [Alsobacter metallidurans]|uniref:2-pyrone-4,6-dicarboxylate hydrolase n=1 Tax=Alsobacter metallidurans TaxID=340221 RepID=A0A917I867_9HYPH|nr:amidohydrolase family protein [Alsobacter metallidurans]GGH22908.1 2-pyrone-4,6-dicarboxylate hydrolase [Alsobacter metallidurans]
MTHAPKLLAPAGACDCHLHIYDAAYPTAPTAVSPGPAWANAAAYKALQQRLGLERSVVVQPTAYGFDNSCTVDAIAALGLERTRGVAVIGADIEEAELRRLTQAGIRGARFQMLPGGVVPWDDLEPVAAKIASHGWHIQLQMDGRLLPDREAMLRGLPCPLVIDHVGKFLEPPGLDHPGVAALLRLLDAGRTWLKLSGPYEVSRVGAPGYDDVAAIAKACVRAAPERMLWASNWPHVSVQQGPDDAAMLDLLLDWATPEQRELILVRNPAAVYGF